MTARPPVGQCGSCKAAVIWCRTSTGKRMPVDVEPVATGNLMLSADRPTPTVLVVSRTGRTPDQQLLYLSHFATCPRSNQQRRRANRQKPARLPVSRPAQDALFGDPGRRRGSRA